MGHADADEVANACSLGRGDGGLGGDQIDGAELSRFGRAGMRRADQLHEDGIGREDAAVSGTVEHVAGDGDRAGRELALRSGADDRVRG